MFHMEVARDPSLSWNEKDMEINKQFLKVSLQSGSCLDSNHVFALDGADAFPKF